MRENEISTSINFIKQIFLNLNFYELQQRRFFFREN